MNYLLTIKMLITYKDFFTFIASILNFLYIFV